MAYLARNYGRKLATDEEADDFSTLLNSQVNRSAVCDTSNILNARAGSGYYSQVMTFQSLTVIPDPRMKIRNIKVPVLIMKGQCDNQLWGFTNEYLQLIGNSRLGFIPDAGHFIAVEQPQLYFSMIREFLMEKGSPITKKI
jgi:proline iminopeptidase